MTKKDYVAVAQAVKETSAATFTNREQEAYILAFQDGKRQALQNFAHEFIRIAQADNARFDRERFLKACGL